MFVSTSDDPLLDSDGMENEDTLAANHTSLWFSREQESTIHFFGTGWQDDQSSQRLCLSHYGVESCDYELVLWRFDYTTFSFEQEGLASVFTESSAIKNEELDGFSQKGAKEGRML